MFCVKRTV